MDKTEKRKRVIEELIELKKEYHSNQALQYELLVGQKLFANGTSRKTTEEIIKDLRKYAVFKESEY